ncbi:MULTISPECIES: hypothetical protein [Streptomyces]|uniref:hypothetical protein n=1 Tax=Streptomyces TaxID=1883 RepID=UPI002553C947|nr:hypothetical protein [Streptomyces sp. NBRC 13847]
MAKTPGEHHSIPALCLAQAEAGEEGLSQRVFAFSSVVCLCALQGRAGRLWRCWSWASFTPPQGSGLW